MAQAVLLGGRHLGERLSELRHEKDGVVAERSRATRLVEDASLDGALERREDAPGAGERDHALEARRAPGFGHAPERLEKLLPVVGVGRLGARVVGRARSRRSVERVDEGPVSSASTGAPTWFAYSSAFSFAFSSREVPVSATKGASAGTSRRSSGSATRISSISRELVLVFRADEKRPHRRLPGERFYSHGRRHKI